MLNSCLLALPLCGGESSRSNFIRLLLDEFKKIIGPKSYSAFLGLLKEIGPDARTHRISIVIAAMLHYALRNLPADYEEGSLAEALAVLEEEPYLVLEESDEYNLLFKLISEICRATGMRNQRLSSRKIPYSIADNAITEFAAWYNMPWED